jgi:hypothetical protein
MGSNSESYFDANTSISPLRAADVTSSQPKIMITIPANLLRFADLGRPEDAHYPLHKGPSTRSTTKELIVSWLVAVLPAQYDDAMLVAVPLYGQLRAFTSFSVRAAMPAKPFDMGKPS